MVELLLNALGGDVRKKTGGAPGETSKAGIDCYHVDARYSASNADVGRARWGKVWLAFKYSLEAIWCRFRWGVTSLYYVPAFPAQVPLYRDWIVLSLCCPFFKRIVYHWHAAGLGDWLAKEARPWERWISQRVCSKPDLSIVLGEYGRGDALALDSRWTEVIPNGIPDPCPEFDKEVLPLRLARLTARAALLAGPAAPDQTTRWFKVLFLSLCTREKGLFDTLEAVALVNQRLAQDRSPLRVQLNVAGKFWRDPEKVEFEQRIARPDLNGGAADSPEAIVRYCGFVAGEEKQRLFRESDCFCFPSYYQAESFGIVLVEAMAHGLAIITARWRTIPELLPPGYGGLVEPRSPEQIAATLGKLLCEDYDPALRARFLEHYTDRQFARRMKEALLSLPAI
jgi:glycosyltransferase involved in cell wall biosynthesis